MKRTIIWKLPKIHISQITDLRATCAFGTVKNRTSTCGNPAVPRINPNVSEGMLPNHLYI